ncbi:hypothetical protein HGM15179_006500 [Zosterops borbonicus]|uniref:Uncharacterized protein n=1 Tax=Zosterops borbonicus TaxID=364589 RepID=A0A8K1GMD9_9PASS|nr:hypothetical protein HGM15179_006500 [Zosterops borbonicus]
MHLGSCNVEPWKIDFLRDLDVGFFVFVDREKEQQIPISHMIRSDGNSAVLVPAVFPQSYEMASGLENTQSGGISPISGRKCVLTGLGLKTKTTGFKTVERKTPTFKAGPSGFGAHQLSLRSEALAMNYKTQ